MWLRTKGAAGSVAPTIDSIRSPSINLFRGPRRISIRGESVEQGGVLQELRVATHTSLNLSEVWTIATNSRTRHSLLKKHPDGCLFCRGEATRTPDPHVPNVVRYQLRYSSKASAKVLLFSHLSKQSKKKHIIFSENCVSISFLWALVPSMHEHLLRSKAIYLLSLE